METKRLLATMIVLLAFVFGWRYFVDYMFKLHPEWKRPGEPATTQPAKPQGATTTPTTLATTQPATSPSVAGSQPTPNLSMAPVRVVSPATQPTTVTLGDATGYSLKINLTSTGAGIDSIVVKKSDDGAFAAPDAKGDYTYQTPFDPSNPETRPLATRSITVNGTEIPLAGVNWNLEAHDQKSATFMLDLGLVRVRKIYELSDAKSPGKGYELTFRHTIENTSPAAAKVKVAFIGPTTPPRESERGPDLQIIGGYDDGYDRVAVDHHMIDEFDKKTPDREITKSRDGKPMLWAGTLSVYFDALVRPLPLDNSTSAKYIEKVTSYAFNPDAEAYARHGTVSFETGELPIEAGKSLDLSNLTYFGPRWRAVLNEPHYAAFPLAFNNTLVLTSGPCGFCTFQFLINGLVKLLALFHFITRDWGLSIICLVVLVRVILHPITKRSQVSMMRMGKLGPEMERLKAKHAEDKDELNRQMMALYKDQGIGMYLGCLPMFLQMPIWIALWSALQSTFELRQAPFLYGLTWIHDLARPDRMITWNPIHIGPLPLVGVITLGSLNILPLFMGVVMFLQQKYTPQPPSTTPEQEAQKKMMLWMSTLLFPMFLYSGPSGLNLYILTSTTIGIIESKRIRAHIKQQEEREKAGKIIVDAPRSMKKKRDDEGGGGAGVKRTTKPPAPKTGLAGWLEQLQNKTNEIRRQAEKKGGK